MIKNNLRKKVISGILAGSVITSLGVTAFASELNQSKVEPDKSIVSEYKQNKVKHKGNFEEILNKLVAEDKITQEKADSVKSYLETNREESKNNKREESEDIKIMSKIDVIEDLVGAGILSSEEANLIREAQQEYRQQKQEDKFKELEESDLFTSSEISKIKSYIEDKKAEQDKELEALKDKTEEERKAYFEENKDKKRDMLSDLVSQGIISEEQRTALKEIFSQDRPFGKFEGKQRGSENILNHIQESGIFSDNEITQIKGYLEEKKTEKDKERESLKDKTEEERKAYFEQNKGERKDIISELVSNGIIAQEQADKLKETMPQKPEIKETKNNQ
ncbi:hypothetical protein Curi_c23340 [Gottschalkia acidurici 9a]|uniref:Uncharacterized protein n=1 Tax=Gottschalkia acidurici (strain ATCC 7906 / DSM 604 / BCRC 14475 / CIP 104303 / KCTC 5404 / NCIMB 10678 / 9a) TaxID=1128398 RepID=K0B450_GOTA9|nr:hypothetical protein [Gottschalkia acidurici]AFS79336.1 hypothetical protein Curi_c23340 [Gottschalkia acidurici 9a]